MNTLTRWCAHCGHKLVAHEEGIPGRRGYLNPRAVMTALVADHAKLHPGKWRVVAEEPKRRQKGDGE